MIEIPLTQGKAAIIDDEDAYLARYEWHAQARDSGRFYAKRTDWTSGVARTVYLHREVMCAAPGTDVDHRNRDGLDCRRRNLRLAVGGGNQQNSARRRGNRSGYKGVCWNAAKSRWQAQVQVDHRNLYLGLYSEAIDAARAYDFAAMWLHGEYARFNFPPTEL